ncbi:hypothetical protein [Streptomyces sp. 3211]|uniref:hypothetical protein n=1 Tax=Streptomyces sp. 3211 TaxID=1964449 RepID=UPI0016077B6D|nr:hypothetical protein [Streptomyces sp. 3211]
MTSVLGLLEAKETAAREQIERLREEADRILVEPGQAESGLERLVIAREMVAEILTGPAVRGHDEAVTCMDTSSGILGDGGVGGAAPS